MRNLVICRNAVLIGMLLFPATATAADFTDWQSIDVLTAGEVTVRVLTRKSASLANHEWIAIEFENQSEQPITIDHSSYRIESERFGRATNKLHSSGGLASGNSHDLFPHAWKSTPVADIVLQPGSYRIVDHPSLYSSALLRLPPRDGLRVESRIHVDVEIDNELFRGEAKFQFDWLDPQQEGFDQMQTRLAKLLMQPRDKVQHAYILGAYLDVPEVAESIAIQQLLDGIDSRTGAFTGRGAILKYVNQHHHASSVLADYLMRRLDAGDKMAMSDLSDLHSAWQDRFRDRFLALIRKPEYIRDGFELLRRRGSPQKNDEALAKQLSATLAEVGILKRLQQDDAEPFVVIHDLPLLGMTHDPAMIAYLAPLLDNKGPKSDSEEAHMFPQTFPLPHQPRRICDHAALAILTILDGSPNLARTNALKRAGLTTNGFSPNAPKNQKTTQSVYDDMIADLKARLGQTK